MNRLDYIQILEKNLLPLIRRKFRGGDYAFQDDNAPVHTAKDVQKWIGKKKIKILSIGLLNPQISTQLNICGMNLRED